MKKLVSLLLATLLGSTFAFGQNYSIGEQTLNLKDSSRNRQIKVELWYPTAETDLNHQRATELPFILEPTIRNASFVDQKHPLVLLSHGTGGNRFGLAWMAIALVKQGYIVAAVDHWGNTFDNKIPKYFVRFWERPLDISFLLSYLLNQKSFSKYIDSERVGMVGFSLGGYTSLALAGVEIDCNVIKKNAKTDEGKKEFTIPEMGDLRKLIADLNCDTLTRIKLKDTRIKAFVALAPAIGLGVESSEQTKNINSPVFIIGAEGDQVAPVLTNAKRYSERIKSSRYYELTGKVGHYTFLNEGDESLKKEAKRYYKDDKDVNRIEIHKQVEELVIKFFEENIKK